MGSSGNSYDLTVLQRRVLKAFFVVEQGFFLSGGAALVGYHLHHRFTDDLDLFTLDPDAFERGRRVLRAVAAEIGASLELRVESPDFLRAALSMGGESLVVDLIRERVKQLRPSKTLIDGITVDPPEEILANKLTALVGRQEERDIVDVRALEGAGYDVERALDAALMKDGACTPANLAWLLSGITIPDGTSLPGEAEPATLRAYVSDLVARLRRLALPG